MLFFGLEDNIISFTFEALQESNIMCMGAQICNMSDVNTRKHDSKLFLLFHNKLTKYASLLI